MEQTQEVKNKDEQKKKKSRLPFIITIIIILLLFSIGAIIAYNVITKVDPDIVILNLINENVKEEADNSHDGYFNAKNVGYELDILTLSKPSRTILWDSVNNVYVLYDGNELVYSPVEKPSEGTALWYFVSKPVASSKFSVYSTETQKVTETVTVEEETVEQDKYFNNHVYNLTTSSDSITYTCTEDGCGYSYTVKTVK